jgi:hypothetical protein
MRHDVLARLERRPRRRSATTSRSSRDCGSDISRGSGGATSGSPDCRSRATARPTSCARRCSRGSSISSRRSGVSEKARCSSG